jgi:O-antigen/teichoic acid export membrane protein
MLDNASEIYWKSRLKSCNKDICSQLAEIYKRGPLVTARRASGVTTRLRQQLSGATGMTTLTNLLILGSNALSGIISARALGPGGRGQLAAAILWSGLVNVVMMAGLPSACCYYIARWPERRSALARYFRRASLGQAAVMTVLSGFIFWWLYLRLHLEASLCVEFTTWAAGSAIAVYGMCLVQGLEDFRRFNINRAICNGLPLVPMAAMALAVRLTPAEAGAAYLVPAWIAALLSLRWFRQLRRAADQEPLARSETRTIRSYGWRNAASLSSMILNANVDQLVVALLVPVSFLGIYNVASSASSPLPSLVTSLGMVGLPTVAALRGRAKSAATWKALRRAIWTMAIVAPVCAAVLPWLLPTLYGREYAAAVVPAELLLAGVSFSALTSVIDDLLRAHERPGFVSISQGAGVVITAIGALIFARRSLELVAIASSAGYAVTFVIAAIRLRAAMRQEAAAPVGRHRGGRGAPVTQA